MPKLLVIKRESINKIYTSDDPEIEFIQFNTKEEANYYIINGSIMPSTKNIIVFTDGACSNNGRKNAKAGIGVFFGENDTRNVSRIIDGKQTNNTAELSAVIDVFKILEKEINEKYEIIIHTDSEYVIKCCTTYGEKCSLSNWKNNKGFISNHELVKEIYTLFANNNNVSIKHVKAHTNNDDKLSIGNYWADKLATDSLNQ